MILREITFLQFDLSRSVSRDFEGPRHKGPGGGGGMPCLLGRFHLNHVKVKVCSVSWEGDKKQRKEELVPFDLQETSEVAMRRKMSLQNRKKWCHSAVEHLLPFMSFFIPIKHLCKFRDTISIFIRECEVTLTFDPSPPKSNRLIKQMFVPDVKKFPTGFD